MKKSIVPLTLLGALAAPSFGALVFNGDFNLTKPGEPGVSATLTAGFVPWNPPNPASFLDMPVNGGSANYGDGSSGPNVDVLGWIRNNGNADFVNNGIGGSIAYNSFASWGGDGRIESAAPVAVVQPGLAYTISVSVDGPSNGSNAIDGPLAFHLLANGTQLTPTSLVDMVTPGGGFQEISRTYDAATMAPFVGQDLTILMGVEDANNGGDRVIWDNVMLAAVPEPSSALLLGLSGLALLRRKRK